MKNKLLWGAASFAALFAVIYIISPACGVGRPADRPGEAAGVWVKIYSSNPAMEGAEGSFIPFTGPATANPYLKTEPETSADCLKCHFTQGLGVSSSSHTKGSVSYAELKKAKDGSCLECHDAKTADGLSSDTEAMMKSPVFSEAARKEGAALITCIGCHGSGGGKHYTKAALNAGDCASCHDKPENCSASGKNPLAVNIASNFKISAHATGTLTEKFYEKTKERGLIKNYEGAEYFPTASCLACHQNLSYQEYFAQKPYFSGAESGRSYASRIDDNSGAFLETPVPPARAGLTLLRDDKQGSGLLCQTCHDVHSGGFTRKAVHVRQDSLGKPLTDDKNKPLGAPVRVFSEEFALCTQCHAVKLDYEWDAKNNRFDYYLARDSHDNATGMENPDDLSLRAATIKDGIPDVSEANTFDYERKQGAHLNFDGGYEEPLFADEPWRMVMDREKTIIDTHFKGVIVSEMAQADGKEYILKRERVEGYNINAAAARPCSGCHDPHLNSKFRGADGKEEAQDELIKLTQTWALSGHADYKSEAFSKDDFEAGCMKCHSGYEGAKIIAGADNPDALDNVTSMLNGTGGEPVYCIACHDLTIKETLNGKETYKPGEARKWKDETFSFSWAGESWADKTRDVISAENLQKTGSSILCWNCHDGARTGRMINAFADGDERLKMPFERKKQAAHYGPAASVMWGGAAYEFPGKEYASNGFPRHKTNLMKKGGLMKTPEEAEQEEKVYIYACADCHDFDEKSHSGAALIEEPYPGAEKDAPKKILGINMTEKRIELGCAEKGCHGQDGTEHAGKAEANRKGYAAALNEVKTAFEKKYDLKLTGKSFVKASDPETKFTAWGEGQAGRNLYGAAHNILLLSVLDKGAYSHNPIYVKQLLHDMMEMAGGSFSKNAVVFVNADRP